MYLAVWLKRAKGGVPVNGANVKPAGAEEGEAEGSGGKERSVLDDE